MRGRIPVWPFSFGPCDWLSDSEGTMAEDTENAIRQNAGGVESAEVDGKQEQSCHDPVPGDGASKAVPSSCGSPDHRVFPSWRAAPQERTASPSFGSSSRRGRFGQAPCQVQAVLQAAQAAAATMDNRRGVRVMGPGRRWYRRPTGNARAGWPSPSIARHACSLGPHTEGLVGLAANRISPLLPGRMRFLGRTGPSAEEPRFSEYRNEGPRAARSRQAKEGRVRIQ